MSRIGVDVDGVLADFIQSYVQLLNKVSGKNADPLTANSQWTEWNAERLLGFTKGDVDTAWADIEKDDEFWFLLPDYSTTYDDILLLDTLQLHDANDIYFITSRPGIGAKAQTEDWLKGREFVNPTVLISKHKGLVAAALDLDAYIDDKSENVLDVFITRGSKTQLYVMDRPWSRDITTDNVKRVTSVREMLEDLGVRNQGV